MIAEGVRIGLELIQHFEGLRLSPHLCPAGVPSIGFGSTRYLDGSAVTLRDKPITAAYAEHLLLMSIYTEYLPALLRLCPLLDTPGRVGALLSFIYNLGPRNLAASTLRKKIAAQQWEEVPAQLMRWRYGGGRELRGLVRRRQAEAALV